MKSLNTYKAPRTLNKTESTSISTKNIEWNPNYISRTSPKNPHQKSTSGPSDGFRANGDFCRAAWPLAMPPADSIRTTCLWRKRSGKGSKKTVGTGGVEENGWDLLIFCGIPKSCGSLIGFHTILSGFIGIYNWCSCDLMRFNAILWDLSLPKPSK